MERLRRLWLPRPTLNSSFSLSTDVDPLVLSFRFHFYPADPNRLGFNGKNMLFQQLRRDLIHGRLYCSPNESAALGALIVQGELVCLLLLDASGMQMRHCNGLRSSFIKKGNPGQEAIFSIHSAAPRCRVMKTRRRISLPADCLFCLQSIFRASWQARASQALPCVITPPRRANVNSFLPSWS